MVSVMKSPNMMSTTGRKPVIAAPTPTPVNPASEIGVFTTRDVPNSSTSPERTLNGVPASATSSPKMKTRESRRISSASASRTASAKVISRVPASGIDVLVNLIRAVIRRSHRNCHSLIHLSPYFGSNRAESVGVRVLLCFQPFGEILDRIAFRQPLLLFFFLAVIFTIDIAHMMPAIAIRIAQKKCRPLAAAGALGKVRRDGMHRTHVLPIHGFRAHSESAGPRRNISRSGFQKMCVFGVHIIFANVNHRQLPQLREVHAFIQHALSQRAFTEKANRDLSRFQGFRRKGGACGDANTSANDGIRSQIPRGGIGDVHRTALSAAVSSFFSQQFRKHQLRRRALGEAVTVAAMRTGDVIIGAQCFANSHGDRFLSDVKVRQARHQRARVQFIHIFFEQADGRHLPVHAQPFFDPCARACSGGVRNRCHFATPDIRASTSKTTAKSCFANPMPRAAVRNSLETAVVGSGTSRARPISRASIMSFCIMFTSNHASAGMLNTNGPRYLIMGDATALWVSTSTATSRAMPLFSASKTPSQNAIICTARLRFVAIFIASAKPLSPTRVTFGPMSSKIGFRRSNVSRRPPTITDSFPSCRVITLPETGASIMSAPFSRVLAATLRL